MGRSWWHQSYRRQPDRTQAIAPFGDCHAHHWATTWYVDGNADKAETAILKDLLPLWKKATHGRIALDALSQAFRWAVMVL